MRGYLIGVLRITAGEHRGRRLPVPKVAATRPLPERARQALFDHLVREVPGAVVWDVYAGSGVLGFEALSRGAARVVAVEKDRRAARTIRETAATLGLGGRHHVIQMDARRLPRLWEQESPHLPRPDLVFFDPPYAEFRAGGERRAEVLALFRALAATLPPGGVAVVHTPGAVLTDEERADFPGIERRDYGSTSLYWWHRPA